jgi:hypothetical protein
MAHPLLLTCAGPGRPNSEAEASKSGRGVSQDVVRRSSYRILLVPRAGNGSRGLVANSPESRKFSERLAGTGQTARQGRRGDFDRQGQCARAGSRCSFDQPEQRSNRRNTGFSRGEFRRFLAGFCPVVQGLRSRRDRGPASRSVSGRTAHPLHGEGRGGYASAGCFD